MMTPNKPLLILILILAGIPATAQQHGGQTAPTTSSPTTNNSGSQQIRDATREKLRTLLATSGPGINVDFRQSEKQPYNFVGILKSGLKNADSLEIVILVSNQETIHFRIYPHYGGAYVNINRAQDSQGLM